MLFRKRQIAAKVENVEGSAVALSADDARLLIINPQINPDIEINERDVLTGTLSEIGSLSGKQMASLTFQLELRGSGTATTAPQWSKLLRACGFQENPIKKLTIGSITNGPYQHGETITQATTGASGRVIIETADGVTTLYFFDLGSGTWNGTNVITGGTSGATATPSAILDAGVEWKPFSDELSQVGIGSVTNGPFTKGELITGGTSGATGYVYEDTADGTSVLKYRIVNGSFQNGETITGGTSGASATTSSSATQSETPTLTIALYDDGLKYLLRGARGKVKLSTTTGNKATLDFDFTGVLESITDAPLLNDISHETTLPPVFLDADVKVDTESLLVTSVEVDINNTVTGRESASDAKGYKSFRITKREITGTMDPEQKLTSDFAFHQKLINNDTLKLDFSIGTTSGNTFRVYAPATQFTDIGDSEREGITVADLTMKLTGSLSPGDDELTILQL